ncbi:hypothetical protein [Rhodococcus sp. RD6.2]|uniref:hypothetical protein n=1 Tax=Rhodococcus sp. RD6.2 TaxID=260936 RepID=UPI0006794792
MEVMEEQGNADLRIHSEVARIWGEWVGVDPDLTPEQRESLIWQEAARLTQMVEEAVGEGGHGGLLDQWRQDNPGLTPDYETVVSSMRQAWERERSRVLTEELYSQVTDEVYQRVTQAQEQIEQESVRLVEQARESRNPDRWKTPWVEPTPLAEKIVDRVWPGQSGRFLVLAWSLIQQRLEDNQPTPGNRHDPLADELGALIEAEMREHPTTTPF